MRNTDLPDGLVVDGAEPLRLTVPEQLVGHVDESDALVSRDPDTGLAAISLRFQPEPLDLAALAAGAPLWVTLLGTAAPVRITVGESPEV